MAPYRRIVSFGALLLLAATGALWAAAGAAQGAPGGEAPSVLSPRSYWRFFYTFGPPRYLSHDGRLVATQSRYASLNGGGSGNQLATEPPPASWTDATFDDSRWCVQRAPLPFQPTVDSDGGGPYTLDCIRRVCARTRFLVAEPARVQRLTLTLKYYGGMLVYLNGREIARGHIPASAPLAGAFYAEPYPPEAYRPVTQEQKEWGMTGNSGFWNSSFYWVPWYYGVKPERKEIHDKFMAFLVGIRCRQLTVTLDPRWLVPGVNVLAIENRCSPIAEIPVGAGNDKFTVPPSNGGYSPRMAHIGVEDIVLTADPSGAVAAANSRPAGVQAWVEDTHRWLLEEDFLEPGVKESRLLRLVGAPGGACSAQAVIGTTRELRRPTARLSALQGPGGAALPASAASVRWARTIPVERLKRANPGAFRTYMQDLFLFRYREGGTGVHFSSGKEEVWGGDSMLLYDRLAPDPPPAVAAGVSQPVWVTVELPRNARPGLYTGELAIAADGLSAMTFAVKLQVIGAPLPAPAAYRSYVGVDESPWALAKAAGVQLWSGEHWRLLEQSIQAAGKLGARVAGIPVIHDTELNNDKDAMVKWVRRGDGSYTFDFTQADRYLGLWTKYCHALPDIVVYMVLTADGYGQGGGTGSVTLLDPATRAESVFTPPQPGTPDGLKLWLECARAVRAHFNSRGIKDEFIHWGLFYDYIGPAGFSLAQPLAKELPSIGWARSSHEGRKIHGTAEMGGGNAVRVTWNAAVRHFGTPPFDLPRLRGGPYYANDETAYQVKDCVGLNDPDRALLLPRADSDVSALGICSPLYQLRSTHEMAMTGRYRGAARICIDGWGRGGYFGPFTPYLLYPGNPGMLDGSAQFEALREGLQELELRLALEQGGTPAAGVKDLLDRRTELAWILPPRPEGVRIGEYFHGWQERSWDLHTAAAAAGGLAPGAADRKRFFDTPP